MTMESARRTPLRGPAPRWQIWPGHLLNWKVTLGKAGWARGEERVLHEAGVLLQQTHTLHKDEPQESPSSVRASRRRTKKHQYFFCPHSTENCAPPYPRHGVTTHAHFMLLMHCSLEDAYSPGNACAACTAHIICHPACNRSMQFTTNPRAMAAQDPPARFDIFPLFLQLSNFPGKKKLFRVIPNAL